MAANVESMFYVREKPWHGLGTMVAETPDSAAALRLAGLDWNVVQKEIMTVDGSGAIKATMSPVRVSELLNLIYPDSNVMFIDKIKAIFRRNQ
ncbi:MAG: hypothetical protein NC417_13830 [Candidatus Gastranaerophilales bacterium]|nr:hypothetical protein [Candidatus Gastranaerophilales bacterium]